MLAKYFTKQVNNSAFSNVIRRVSLADKTNGDVVTHRMTSASEELRHTTRPKQNGVVRHVTNEVSTLHSLIRIPALK